MLSNSLSAAVPLRAYDATVASNGVGTNFGVGVEEARPERAESGDGVLGEGTASPSPPTRGLQKRCKLPQQGSGRGPGRRRVFLYSEPSIAFPSICSRPYALHTVCMARC